jgi:hypothetical protein
MKMKVGDTVWIGGRSAEKGQSGIVTVMRNYGARVKFDDGHERPISYRVMSMRAPVVLEPMVAISVTNLNDILYHLESAMSMMRFGREYNKIVKLLGELPLKGRDLSEFYYIDRLVNPK